METANDNLSQGRSSEKVAQDLKVGGILGIVALVFVGAYILWKVYERFQ